MFSAQALGLVVLLSLCATALASFTVESEASAQGAFGGAGGRPTENFSDDLEAGSPGWWFSTTNKGNGYVAARSDCISGTHCADEYSSKNPVGDSQMLSRSVVFSGSIVPSDCDAYVAIKPLTAVSGALEIENAATHTTIRAQDFNLPAGGWQFVFTGSTLLNAPNANSFIVRVRMYGNGAWQEFLFDNLNVSCTL